MAGPFLSLASAAEKQFNNGVGFLKFQPLAVVTVGSSFTVALPQNVKDVALVNVMNSIGVGYAAASYTWAVSKSAYNTTTKAYTPSYAVITTGAGMIMATYDYLNVLVIM